MTTGKLFRFDLPNNDPLEVLYQRDASGDVEIISATNIGSEQVDLSDADHEACRLLIEERDLDADAERALREDVA